MDEKNIRKLLRKAEKAGFEVNWAARHYKVTSPAGDTFGVSRSPADGLAWKKILCDFKRAGLRL
jgi:hypothetical protein